MSTESPTKQELLAAADALDTSVRFPHKSTLDAVRLLRECADAIPEPDGLLSWDEAIKVMQDEGYALRITMTTNRGNETPVFTDSHGREPREVALEHLANCRAKWPPESEPHPWDGMDQRALEDVCEDRYWAWRIEPAPVNCYRASWFGESGIGYGDTITDALRSAMKRRAASASEAER